ncbi:sulfate reduction electron transfer complex DsrMKJOP subunit DsrJ [Desulfovibrio sp. OttesenSCG-928-I05]|nr:sulfate reduction electron transfer complex DsrMKJOP subunit DsrJ [Desulfovibrio sp. OttesenSCG-928-I05]
MYNARYIIPGIILFVVIFTVPFWINICTPEYSRPELVLPAEKDCIEPVEYMRAEHMRILNEWRDAALRDGKRVYIATDGRQWDINLQNTCMSCHTDKVAFCDTCHDTNSVTPYCWDCHIEPQTAPAAGGAKQ